jgi:hypothetical protein
MNDSGNRKGTISGPAHVKSDARKIFLELRAVIGKIPNFVFLIEFDNNRQGFLRTAHGPGPAAIAAD